MKNTLILMFTLVGISLGVNAQSKLTLGARAGINLSQIRGDGKGSSQSFWDDESARTIGFTGGLFARIGDKFYLQPEFIISQKGGKTKNALGIETDFKQTYFDVPVLVGTKIGKIARINAGPMATFLINKNDSFLEQIGVIEKDEGFRKAILGYQAGVGFDIGKITLDMRYEGNVNDVFNINYKDSQTESQFAGKGNLWFVTLGYKF